MMFKELKAGHPLYIFERKTIKVTPSKVVSVSPPRYDTRMGNADMVVDVNIETTDGQHTYVLKESSDTGYVGSTMLTTERENVMKEVENLKATSVEAINKIDEHKEIVAKCDEILETMSPEAKHVRESEERLSRLEESVDKIRESIEKMMDAFSRQDH